ncbi:hypothetical protein C7N43_01815 [Sphingobacteriales bacterium UPWRP_1]|nr:hypothetical protein B6N25_15160 [Sphingobacteriales bacterium TSM_CSS]PSJ78763.1 hypothetical protein C7N43_01815 [Sphingobacteriales bacterium UPWRP_1]
MLIDQRRTTGKLKANSLFRWVSCCLDVNRGKGLMLNKTLTILIAIDCPKAGTGKGEHIGMP